MDKSPALNSGRRSHAYRGIVVCRVRLGCVIPAELWGTICLFTLLCLLPTDAAAMSRSLAETLVTNAADAMPGVSMGEFVRMHPVASVFYVCLLLALMVLAFAFWRARARQAAELDDFQRLIDCVPIGLYEIAFDKDSEGRLTFMSERAKQLAGLEHSVSGPVRMQDAIRVLHPGDVKRFARANRRGIEKGDPFLEDLRCLIDGEVRWLRVSSNPRTRLDGTPVWTGYVMDITELRNTRARFQAIFEQSPVAIFLHDAESGAVLEANDRAWKQYGFDSLDDYKRDQQKTWLDEPPYTREDAAQRVRAAHESRPHTFEWASQRLDGSRIWHEVTLAPISFGEENRVLALCVDITDRRESERLLRESEMRFRTMLEDVPGVAVQGYTADGTVHYWNRASERLYGYSQNEALGANLFDLIIPENLRDGVRESLKRAFREGRDIENGELELIRKDGSPVLVYSSHTLVRRPGPEPELFSIDIDLTERQRHEADLAHAANHDSLTGLPNRNLLGELMRQLFARSERQRSSVAVCYLDLDGFKPINDRHGHAVGDDVLVEMARRLQHMVRSSDVVARLGGDEFVVLLEGLGEPDELQARLHDMIAGLARPIVFRSCTVGVTASIGVTLFPRDSADPDTLLRHADQAMYEAKAGGRNRFKLFDPALEQQLAQRGQRRLEIEKAISEKQFVLHYQPKIDLRTGEVTGVEGLVRWEHPKEGCLSPAAFLDDLEGEELGHAFGEYVIDQALLQLERWAEAEVDWPISVNITGLHLLSDSFYERLVMALEQRPSVKPERLELEVLESAAVTDLDMAVSVTRRCRALGMGVSLDDFGTGYSSLSRLRVLPLTAVKIDQSFILGMLENLNDHRIVQSVISLAGTFDLNVIAEGVETLSHANRLMEMGCEQGQGYVFARPMSPEALLDWYENWKRGDTWRELADLRKDMV